MSRARDQYEDDRLRSPRTMQRGIGRTLVAGLVVALTVIGAWSIASLHSSPNGGLVTGSNDMDKAADQTSIPSSGPPWVVVDAIPAGSELLVFRRGC